MKYLTWLLMATLVVLSEHTATAQLTILGSETQANSTTARRQARPAVAMDQSRDFVVVWQQSVADNNEDIYFQRFTDAGVATGSETLVNTSNSISQVNPSVAMADDGRFAICWMGYTTANAYDIYFTLYNSSGTITSSEATVNTTTSGNQKFPRIASDPNLNHVIVWEDESADGDSWGIFFQRFNSSGVAQGSETAVNTTIAGSQQQPDIAMDPNGNFVIVWQGINGAGNYDIYGQRFNASGVAQGGEFVINANTAGNQIAPRVSLDDVGNFVVAWTSEGQDGDGEGVYAATFNASGVTTLAEFKVNVTTTAAQDYADVTMMKNGTFAISWNSFSQDGDAYGVYTRIFNSLGLSNTPTDQLVNTTTSLYQQFPAIAGYGNTDSTVIVWQSGDNNSTSTQDGSDYGIYLQRYEMVPTSNVDAFCQNITVNLDASGNISILASEVDNGSSADAAPISFGISQSSFDCTNTSGPTNVTLTVTDALGNTASCTADVSVVDNTLPNAVCQNASVFLDANGNASITANDIDGGSNDACGIASLSISNNAFTCANVGNNSVTLTVTDVNNNEASCAATVVVIDAVNPTVVCQAIAVFLDGNGNGSITAADVDGGSNDACGIASISISNSAFTCLDIGSNTVTLSVTDVNNNTASCITNVTVIDTTSPTAVCQNITVQLDASGNASITAADVDGGSNDNCGIAALSLSTTSFGCANVGSNNVTLTVTDVNNNNANCAATVTFQDNVNPTAVCQAITISLDASGNASITAADVDGGSNDACGIAALSLSTTTFGCANVGSNSVTFTVTDVNNNDANCAATVTVQDNVNPTAVCQAITVQLDANGNASITAADVDGGSNDNCGIAALSLSTTTFGCANVGSNSVTLTVTDVNNNDASCAATVTVQDNVNPTAVCQNITVQLDASGNASITAADVDGGSNDNCEIAALSLSTTSFGCANVGSNSVTLTVTDVNNNNANCAATVTVQDNVNPTAVCQAITVSLDANGNASITTADVDGGSNDNCGIAALSLSNSAFTCSHVGSNSVSLTVTDANNNTASCVATVSVQDNVAPTAVCQDITVQLDVSGNGNITASDIDGGSNDACGIASISISPTAFTCADVGTNQVTLSVTDVNQNTSSCIAWVEVEDNIGLHAICQDVTVFLDVNGSASISGTDVDGGSNDACNPPTSFTLNQSTFDCNDVSTVQTVTLTVGDGNGNTATCQAHVTVIDNLAPVPANSNLPTITGTCGASVFLAPTGFDNCAGIVTATTSSPTSYSTPGTYTIVWVYDDGNGNTATVNQTVIVQDFDLDGDGVSVCAGDCDDNDPNNFPGNIEICDGQDNDCDGLIDEGFNASQQIVAFVWDDQNGNGKQDNGEPGVEGVEVKLLQNNGSTVISTAFTDVDGNATFICLSSLLTANQNVRLQFVAPTDHKITLKDRGSNDNIDSDADVNNGKTISFTVDPNTPTTKWDAGVWVPGEVQAFVWEDLNGNGKQDNGEGGLAGRTVDLLENNGSTLISTAQTDASGIATFEDVPTDRPLKLKFHVFANERLTPKDQGSNDNIDSDPDVNNGKTQSFQLSAGSQIITHVDAGMWTTGDVEAFVWEDLNGNGKQDNGEGGLAGRTVQLLENNGSTVVATTTSGSDGIAKFDNVPANRPMRLRFFTLANEKLTQKDQGSNNNIDSDADVNNGKTISFSADRADDLHNSVDAGIWTVGDVEAFVWEDLNGNGKQDNGEGGLAGRTVQLLENNGSTVVATTTSGSDGIAKFDNVPANRPMRLRFFTLANEKLTQKDQGSNNNIDSDADVNNGKTQSFSADRADDLHNSVDAGIWTVGDVEAFVWEDLNGNGKQDNGEGGLVGREVSLLENNGSTVLATTTTGSDGIARFSDVPADRPVRLQFGLLANERRTLRDQGSNDNIDSDADVNNGKTNSFSADRADDLHTMMDAGIWTTGFVEAYVWEDLNGNGKQDNGEGPLANREVQLLENNGSTVVGSASTGADGIAYFSDVPANRPMRLRFFTSTDEKFTQRDQGSNNNIDSDADVNNGKTISFTANRAKDTETSVDAGIWTPGTVEAFVWDDLNGNGKQDANEPGLENVQVQLLENNGSTVITDGLTNDDGFISLSDVPADRPVKLRFFTISGYVRTTQDAGSNDNIDSDANTNNGRTVSFFANRASQVFTSWDGGLKSTSTPNRLFADDGTEPEAENAFLKVYPNPSSALTTIELPVMEHAWEIHIFDTKGSKVLTLNMLPGESKLQLDVADSKFTEGVYLIQAIGNQTKLSKRLVIIK